MLKKADIVLIVLLFLVSLLPLTKFGQPGPACYAEIRQDGKVIQHIRLTGHIGITEMTIPFPLKGTEKHNLIRIENEQIAVRDADCPDKICVQTGAISQPGEIIACLPHKLIIEIKSE
ncbi:MAG: NusG domain II-containing protein [Selenomonas sp.]|nr:NusG domain II-containing protein [Selenomonas sp.]